MQDGFSLSEKEFAMFCEVITSFHTIRDMDEMLVTIFQKVSTVIDIQGASIALHDPANKEFYFIRTIEKGKSRGDSDHHFLRFPDNIGVAGWVMSNDQAAIINDVSKDQRYYDGLDSEENFVTAIDDLCPFADTKGISWRSLCSE